MPDDNRISATLADDDLAAIHEALNALRARLPWLLSLTTAERVALAKLGDKSVGFDEKCRTYMASKPEFLPGFVSAAEVDKDRVLRTQVQRVLADVRALADQLDDTLMVLGNELWLADLAYYQNVRAAARRGIPGAEIIYEDLRARFPGAPRQTQTEPAD